MKQDPKYYFYKDKFKFEKLFDFNELVKTIDLAEQSSEFSMSRKVNTNYVFDSTFVMRGISNTSAFFKDLNKMLDQEFNKNKIYSDTHLYINFVTAGKAAKHVDPHDVIVLGLYGETMYILNENEKVIVSPGDLLHIEEGVYHRAIALSPRIIASYSFNGNVNV